MWDGPPPQEDPAGWDERAEAAALSEGEGTGHGVERYLIRFWPAGA
ncbi:hypothetical protein [Streptomyces pilosus]|nr:hypothetical protein [Streptomyces pilosus]